jgi:hypothetical protein
MNPDIFAPAFEHILHMLENEWFRKFLTKQRETHNSQGGANGDFVRRESIRPSVAGGKR